ncbi:hypothetical protein KQX54_005171 [Cotesia glomerata]|uniref:Uncharacterized protein n=1 Tax=Cotesia glomerata TaxID=32391 RepID=A0AAV7I760_COTGL|nr:hypothetical protein KQX54_005171 [Cotesia glomerata]
MATGVACGRALPGSIPLGVISGNFCGAQKYLGYILYLFSLLLCYVLYILYLAYHVDKDQQHFKNVYDQRCTKEFLKLILSVLLVHTFSEFHKRVGLQDKRILFLCY